MLVCYDELCVNWRLRILDEGLLKYYVIINRYGIIHVIRASDNKPMEVSSPIYALLPRRVLKYAGKIRALHEESGAGSPAGDDFRPVAVRDWSSLEVSTKGTGKSKLLKPVATYDWSSIKVSTSGTGKSKLLKPVATYKWPAKSRSKPRGAPIIGERVYVKTTFKPKPKKKSIFA